MKSISILTRIEGGQFKLNRKAIKKAVEIYEGKEIEIIFKTKYKRRSLQENNYYWGVVVEYWKVLMFEEWGESKSSNEAHEELKHLCNYKEVVNKNTGEIIKISQSTKDLGTMEFEEYLERCRRLAFEYFNVIIPLPNEQLELNFK